jgi:uncharacterized protein YcfJ
MSTKTVRSIAGSLRLIGVTAAVAAGIAGFAPVETEVATTDVAVVAHHTQLSQVFKLPHVRQLPKLPPQVCEKLIESDRVPAEVIVKLGCVVTPPPVVVVGPGPVEGVPIFS